MESQKHKHAKERLSKILSKEGFSNIQSEVPFKPIMFEATESRTYTADIIAEKANEKYIFEVDGFKGHTTRRNTNKDKLRDGLLGSKGYRTIRVRVEDIIGRKALPDEKLKEEIAFRCSGYTTLRAFRPKWQEEELTIRNTITVEGVI